MTWMQMAELGFEAARHIIALGKPLVQAHACMDACTVHAAAEEMNGAAVAVQVQARQARTARPTATRF
jgi:hypothetical protein